MDGSAMTVSTREPGTAGASNHAASTGRVLTSLGLCTLLPALGNSIANVALPTLASAFDASFQQMQWVVIAYLLASTALVVSVGRLGDMLGRRRLLLAGISLFTLASMLCGVAPTLGLLIAARAAQGLAAAVMLALAMALVGEAIPKARTGSAMGMLGTMSAVGTALGPTLGGVLIAGLGWRAIFLVNLPLGVAAYFLARRCLPADRQATPARQSGFDIPGTLLIALTLGAYALAMTWGRGSFDWRNTGLLLAAALGVALFVLVETKVEFPLIRLARLRDPILRAGLVTSALVSTVVMTTLVVGPFYLFMALGLDTARVGLVMSVGPVFSALTGLPAGRLVNQRGAGRMVVAGLLAMFAGCLALCFAPTSWGVVAYAVPIAVIAAGYALFQAANNTAVMADVSPDQRGVVSDMLNLCRNLGLITGASAMGAVFAMASGTVAFTTEHPESVGSGLHATFAVAAVLVSVALLVSWTGQSRTQRTVGDGNRS